MSWISENNEALVDVVGNLFSMSAAIIAVFGNTWDVDKRKLTRLGIAAVVVALLGCGAAILGSRLAFQKEVEDDAAHQEEVTIQINKIDNIIQQQDSNEAARAAFSDKLLEAIADCNGANQQPGTAANNQLKRLVAKNDSINENAKKLSSNLRYQRQALNLSIIPIKKK